VYKSQGRDHRLVVVVDQLEAIFSPDFDSDNRDQRDRASQ
jgi:hypothetical protein